MNGVGYGLVVPPKKSDPPAAAPSWDGRLAQKIGQRVALYRKKSGKTAQELSDALKPLGVELKRTVIGNLESGYRRTVSVAEVLAIAQVLEVPPLALLVPVGEDAEFEVLNDTVVDTWSAARWITGEWDPERPSSDQLPGLLREDGFEKSRRWNVELLDLYRRHQVEVTAWTRNQSAIANSEEELDREFAVAQRVQRTAEEMLRVIRRAIRSRGDQLPALPPALARRLNEEGTVDGQPDD